MNDLFPCHCGHLESLHKKEYQFYQRCRHSSNYMFDCWCDEYIADNLRYLEYKLKEKGL